MADNVAAQSVTTAGTTFATDDIAGVHYPITKLAWGALDTANIADTASGKPIPIQLRSSGGVEPVIADDAAFTPATTPVVMVGFQFDDTLPDSVNEGDAGAARMSANRNVYTTIRDAAGNERGVNVNASNQLAVSVDNTVTVGSHAVTNAGTFAVQVDGSALTALQLIDDIVFTDDLAFTPATSKIAVIGGEFDDTLPDSVDEGDAGAFRMSANRCQYVNIRDNAGNERGLNVDASGNIAVTQSGTWNIGTVTTVTTCSTVTTLSQFAGNAINLGAGAAGTGTLRTITASDSPEVTSLGVMDDWDNTASDGASVSGDVAHDGVDAGEPVKVGAVARSSEQTAVANADRVNLVADLVGKLITLPYCNPENLLDGTNTATSSTANVEIEAAQAAGVRIYATGFIVSNSSTTFTEVNIKDGITIRLVYPAPGTSGACHPLPSPLQGTAATALNFNTTGSVAAVKVSYLGYKGA